MHNYYMWCVNENADHRVPDHDFSRLSSPHPYYDLKWSDYGVKDPTLPWLFLRGWGGIWEFQMTGA